MKLCEKKEELEKFQVHVQDRQADEQGTQGQGATGVTNTLPRDSYLVLHRRRAAAQVYDKDLGRDDVLGTLEFDLCKLKMGHGPKDIEKTIDMNWMGMVKGATLSLTLHNKGGWGEFDG